MKRYTLFMFLCLILCSCKVKNKYEEYTKYNIKDISDSNSYIDGYSYYDGKEEQRYIIEKISLPMCENFAIYYYIGNDEYILLDDEEKFHTPFRHKFINNKLYILNHEYSLLEYTLDKENTTKKQNKLEYVNMPFPEEELLHETSDKIEIESFEIDNNKMYLTIKTYRVSYFNALTSRVECSLSNYKCEVIKE